VVERSMKQVYRSISLRFCEHAGRHWSFPLRVSQ
jgi:hypothetical protein